MLKIALPAFGKSLDFNCATEQPDVALLVGIERGDIANFDTAFAFFDEFDRVTDSDFTLLQYGKIEARALAREKPFDDVRAVESDAELVTRHAWLGHHHDGRADAKF